jgi:hypothetical protein
VKVSIAHRRERQAGAAHHHQVQERKFMSALARVSMAITALASIFAVLTSTADAVTWHNSGSTAFTATSGSVTLSVGSNNLTCSGGNGKGTSTTTTAVGSSFTVNGTATFTPCLLAGQATYTHCSVSNLAASSYAAGVSTGLSTVTCLVRLTASNTPLCVIEGTAPGQYINPSGASPGRLTGLTSGSGLVVTHASGTSCVLGTGPGHISERTGTLSSVAGSPILNRTP